MKRYAAALIAIIFLSLPLLLQAPPPALAANTATTVISLTETQAQPDTQDIPAEKVDRFAAAYLQVLQLLSDRESELPAAETSAEALKIQQSIEADAIALIKESGLTMPEYMEILNLASQDETFRDKVLGRLDESLTE
ncbi:MAG: DUF4168 domain-containing protein [Cyanobacteria bacterium P01_F01_bin.53]